MEAFCFSDTSVTFCRLTQCNPPKESISQHLDSFDDCMGSVKYFRLVFTLIVVWAQERPPAGGSYSYVANFVRMGQCHVVGYMKILSPARWLGMDRCFEPVSLGALPPTHLRREQVQLVKRCIFFFFLKIIQWAKCRYLIILTQNLLALKFKLADTRFSLSPCSPHTQWSLVKCGIQAERSRSTGQN